MIITDAQRSHSSLLSIHLVDVGYTFGKHICWDFVAVFVSEFGSLLSSASNLGSSISYEWEENVSTNKLQGNRTANEYLRTIPVMTQPIFGVSWKTWVIVEGSSSLSYQLPASEMDTLKRVYKHTQTLDYT